MPKIGAPTLVAEFTGTFILVTTVCCAIMSASPLAPISIACSLMVGIYSLGNVSGANFNPAVSSGLFIANKLGHAGLNDFTWQLTGAYKVTQLLAGLFAALFAGLVYGPALGGAPDASASLTQDASVTPATWAGLAPLNLTQSFPTLGADNGYEMWSKLLAEMFYTCMLVFTVLNTATDVTKAEKGNGYFGLSIGFVIMAGANAIGHVSGCSLNPAVSFGLAMGSIIFGSMNAGTALTNFVLYSVAEGFGCLLAACLFAFVRQANIKKRTGGKEEPSETMASKCGAEFIGTFYLILTVCLVCSAPAAPALGVVGIASSLMVMIYSLGAVSGANFNPAVSLGLGMRGELAWADFAAYFVNQLGGGFVGAGIAAAIEAGNASRGYNLALIAVTPNIDGVNFAGKGTWAQIILGEFFYTFLLVLVVLNTAAIASNAANKSFGLAIGMCVTVGGIAVGGITGGCFNPAVSFALGIGGLYARGTGGQNAWFFVYWIAQFLGAAAAAGVTAAAQGSSELEPADEESGGEDAAMLS